MWDTIITGPIGRESIVDSKTTIVGPLTANDQAIIAAGEGAIAAVDLKGRLLER
jgi:bifunctional N-acetylglucosamine-1-phosphate-uridyltransferase/glucosamine-1-phosphate-acetyltransferase GlmU-like protein